MSSNKKGYTKREALGIRQSPAKSATKTGQHAKPETVQHLFEMNPPLEELYQFHLRSESLYDFRPVFAQARASLDSMREHAMRDKSGAVDAAMQRAQRAIDSAEATLRMGGRLASIEERLSPVTRSAVQRMIDAVAFVLKRFVPPDRLEEAEDYLRSLLSEPDVPVGVAASRSASD